MIKKELKNVFNSRNRCEIDKDKDKGISIYPKSNKGSSNELTFEKIKALLVN